jgi:hypothetical protein
VNFPSPRSCLILGGQEDKMARRFFAALALAHSATALLEGFVDVLVQVDEVRVPADLFAGVLQAAGSDDGYEACETANAAIGYCYEGGYLERTVPVAVGNSCLCCDGPTGISAAYSSCATYASNEAPDATSVYRAVSQIYSICANSVDCGATATSRRAPTRTASGGGGSSITLPPVCSSMLDIYSSCSEKLDVQTAGPRDAAECFCPESAGTVNTVFQDYASSCAPFVRSSFPGDYSIIRQLATYCDQYPPLSTEALLFTTAGTRTGLDFARPSTTSPPGGADDNGENNNDDDEISEGSESTSISSGLAAPGLAVPGVIAWFANLATLFLSFFILI